LVFALRRLLERIQVMRHIGFNVRVCLHRQGESTLSMANSSCHRQLKKTATMALPTKIVQIEGHRLSAHWIGAIQPTIRAVMVKILLITEKLPLQIRGCLK
jgi:hypothetical protein